MQQNFLIVAKFNVLQLYLQFLKFTKIYLQLFFTLVTERQIHKKQVSGVSRTVVSERREAFHYER